jgi:septal ring factor EnvC (AmiA/AmiB activator)
MRTTNLTKELSQVKNEKDKQISLLLNKIDLQDEAGRKINRTLAEKMKKLQNALEDRNSTMNTLTAKLSMTEADLALSEQRCSDLEHSLQRMQLEKDNQIQSLNVKGKRDKDVRIYECEKKNPKKRYSFYLKDLISDKLKLEKEIDELSARNLKLDDKVKELERRTHELTSSMYEAREKV